MSHVHDVVIVIMAGLAIWACSVGMQVAMGPTHVQVMKLKVVGIIEVMLVHVHVNSQACLG